MNSIAFVTTCKGRLHHLKKTLPTIVAEKPSEIVVVDYGCPQHAGDWVEKHFPQIRVVRVDDDPGFCLSRARNLGAAQTTSPWICFIDADIQIESGFLGWLRDHINPPHYYRAAQIKGKGKQKGQVGGTVVCTSEAFDQIDGYDEVFRNWGGEDNDLYYRLKLSGHSEDDFPDNFLDPIPHGDSERVAFHEIKNKPNLRAIFKCYSMAKQQLMKRHYSNKQPPLGVRQMLMTHVMQTVLRCPTITRQPEFNVDVKSEGDGWFGGIYRKLMRVDQLVLYEESLQKDIYVSINPMFKTRIRHLLGK